MSSTAFGIGVSAMAAVLVMQNNRKSRNRNTPPPSACASARVANNPPPEETDAEETWSHDDHWGLSDEVEKHMSSLSSIPNNVGETSKIVKDALKAVKPKISESLGTRNTGKTIPVLGRNLEESSTQPTVSGGCMFYMSDRYTRRLEEQ